MIGTPEPPPASLRSVLFATWPGRLLVGAAALELLLSLLRALVGPSAATGALSAMARLVLIGTAFYFLVRFLVLLRRHLLWRVRRRLLLSYVFVGVIPVILLVSFFIPMGVLLSFQVGTYLFRRGIDDSVARARLIAQTAARELAAEPNDPPEAVLARIRAQHVDRFPSLALARLSWGLEGGGPGLARAVTVAGAWSHAAPPSTVPDWISVGGFEGVVAATSATDPGPGDVVLRAVEVSAGGPDAFAVVVDLPLDEVMLDTVREASGVECHLESLTVVSRTMGAADAAPAAAFERTSPPFGWRWVRLWNSKTSLPLVDWTTGRPIDATTDITLDLADVYERVSSVPEAAAGMSLREALPFGLGLVAVLFLIVQAAALLMGLTLARSITGSIDELFVGTERVMQGDFAHRIRIAARDQLGELAQSFNRMTASVESLLQQAAEKKRLEEELRIARDIQMSLLPSGPLNMPGLSVTALCVPAREVGGDYYDFFRLSETRLGVLIADVAGKGTSAALYMAELKGLMLSLSQIHHSPKPLLIEANRILSEHLDSRSFITMTYAVIDMDADTITYARAGHTPLIHLSGDEHGRHAALHVPDGLVLGLRLDGIGEMFANSLEERTLPLSRGDVFVLYTDGVTEAMDAGSDLFGDERLRQVIEEHGDLPSEQLRERIVRDIEAFVGGADQHDDLTLILVKVESRAGDALRSKAMASA